MTRKVYKSAMGKPVDLGALLLQNEQVRAVGNMGVNAAGDLIDSANKVIDQRNRQVQRQYRRQTNVSDMPVSSGTLSAKRNRKETAKQPDPVESTNADIDLDMSPSVSEQPMDAVELSSSGGLAAAIARQREVKQELEKSLKQRRQEQGVKKI